jgi:hypothetical protein
MNNLNSNSKNKELQIGIFGVSFDTGNMGVSALASSLIGQILNQNNNAKVYLLIGNKSNKPQNVLFDNKEKPISVVNYRLSYRAKINDHIFWIFTLAILHRLIPSKKFRAKIISSNVWLKTLNNLVTVLVISMDYFSSFWEVFRVLFLCYLKRSWCSFLRLMVHIVISWQKKLQKL